MTSIWAFLLQTLSVALTGLLLLLVKWLLQDKLTPRWQYGVWVVLALRILIPVRALGRGVLVALPLWLETARLLVERSLNSVYSGSYEIIENFAPIPILHAAPQSVTDWIFVIYAAGAAVTVLWYLFSYLRLRGLLRHGMPASAQIEARIQAVGEKYGLKPCRAVVIDGLPSPMVCGVIRPVLALPAEGGLDDHVILHELLHLKYHDALQNIFWSLCRALHWCDPLVHLFINRIGNDLESLCDQRVLERLEGEQRRDYGKSLLAMANDKYPRAPGTTSVSNGGRNIRRRIEAIVRFKRYPRGMALASVCVTVLLISGCLMGTVPQTFSESQPVGDGPDWQQAKFIATARHTPCTTMAGAIDAYAKGLRRNRQDFLMAVSPTEVRADLEKGVWTGQQLTEIWHKAGEKELSLTGLDPIFYETVWADGEITAAEAPLPEALELMATQEDFDGNLYWICNLHQTEEGVSGQVIFPVQGTARRTGETGEGERVFYEGIVIHDVFLWKQQGRWRLQRSAPAELYLIEGDAGRDLTLMVYQLVPSVQWETEGRYGTVAVQIQAEYRSDASVNGWLSGFFVSYGGEEPLSTTMAYPNVEFNYARSRMETTFFLGEELRKKFDRTLTLQVAELNEDGSVPEMEPIAGWDGQVGSSSGGNAGAVYWTSERIRTDTEKLRLSGSGGSTGDADIQPMPPGYAAMIVLDGQSLETILVREVKP